jgi:Flp pilus assembly protein TadB
MWIVSAALAIVWFVLTFLFHKAGYVHIILIGAVSVFVVQFTAYRKTQYHKQTASGKNKSDTV